MFSFTTVATARTLYASVSVRIPASLVPYASTGVIIHSPGSAWIPPAILTCSGIQLREWTTVAVQLTPATTRTWDRSRLNKLARKLWWYRSPPPLLRLPHPSWQETLPQLHTTTFFSCTTTDLRVGLGTVYIISGVTGLIFALGPLLLRL